MKIVLVGNPNVGKTTLLNSLTRASEHTGNWHGVTVDSSQKSFTFNGSKYEVVDLPGVYSLSPLSHEEKISCDYLYNHTDIFIVNILDANNLNRNFYLTLELLKLNLPMMIVINKTGANCIYHYNQKKLENFLQVDVVEIDASNKKDVNYLKQKINKCISENVQNNACIKNKNKIKLLKNSEKIEDLLQKTKNLIKNNEGSLKLNDDYVAYKCLQNDEIILNKLKLSKEIKDELKKIQNEIAMEDLTINNYNIIKNIFNCSQVKREEKVYAKSSLDKFVLNKYLCLPIFFFSLIAVFYITFFSVGKVLGSIFSNFTVNVFGRFLLDIVKSVTGSQVVYDFFNEALISGIGSVLSFLPQVVILFLCLGLLEDSGYLSRLAFCLDDIFSRIGLSGRSIYTLLMGFGCSGIAVCTARTMQDKNSQIKTALLAPYMSCSAKLPIYSVIGGAFFGASNVFIIFALYLLGALIAMLLSLFFEKTFLKTDKSSFILEFPPYRKPSLGKIKKSLLYNTKQFLIRVGTILISVNVIVWVLSNFSFAFSYVPISGQKSMIEVLGKIISPIFLPLGFGTWGASSAILAGLIAKEMVVSSLAIFNGVPIQSLSSSLTNPASTVSFSPASAISFMLFCLLYTPCMATLGILKKEIGTKWFIISFGIQFVIAYVVSLISYSIVNIVLNKGILFLLLTLAMFCLFSYAIYFLLNKKKTLCKNCTKCRKD